MSSSSWWLMGLTVTHCLWQVMILERIKNKLRARFCPSCNFPHPVCDMFCSKHLHCHHHHILCQPPWQLDKWYDDIFDEANMLSNPTTAEFKVLNWSTQCQIYFGQSLPPNTKFLLAQLTCCTTWETWVSSRMRRIGSWADANCWIQCHHEFTKNVTAKCWCCSIQAHEMGSHHVPFKSKEIFGRDWLAAGRNSIQIEHKWLPDQN